MTTTPKLSEAMMLFGKEVNRLPEFGFAPFLACIHHITTKGFQLTKKINELSIS
jgi:hypothetical protein